MDEVLDSVDRESLAFLNGRPKTFFPFLRADLTESTTLETAERELLDDVTDGAPDFEGRDEVTEGAADFEGWLDWVAAVRIGDNFFLGMMKMGKWATYRDYAIRDAFYLLRPLFNIGVFHRQRGGEIANFEGIRFTVRNHQSNIAKLGACGGHEKPSSTPGVRVRVTVS
jgi:hypothetical protein